MMKNHSNTTTATTPTDTSMLPRSITTKLLSLSTHDLYDDKFLGVEVALHDDLFMQQPPSRDMNSTGVVIGGGYHGARNPLHRRSHSTSEVDQNQNQILYHRSNSNSNSNSNYSKLEDGDIIEIIVWERVCNFVMTVFDLCLVVLKQCRNYIGVVF